MATLGINRRLSLDWDCIKVFISDHIRGLIVIYNVCGVKDERAWDLFNDIIFLDPVTTRHISQFQLMWPHRRSRSSPVREWWAVFRSYMGQMYDRMHDQMNNWRWDNPHAFGDQVDRSNPWKTSSGQVTRTSGRFSWYGSDGPRAKIEPPNCRQYKPGDFLAVRPLYWDQIMDEDDHDENWADPRALSGGTSHPNNNIDNDNSEGEEDTQGGEKGTGKEKGTMDGKGKEKGKWKGKANGQGKAMKEGMGKGNGNGKGKGIVKQSIGGYDISHGVAL